MRSIKLRIMLNYKSVAIKVIKVHYNKLTWYAATSLDLIFNDCDSVICIIYSDKHYIIITSYHIPIQTYIYVYTSTRAGVHTCDGDGSKHILAWLQSSNIGNTQ